MGDTKCRGLRSFAKVFIFAALNMSWAAASFSQTFATGYPAGLVKDARGSVAPSAIVTFKRAVETIARD